MDPDETLKSMREAIATMEASGGGPTFAAAAETLAESTDALDQWLSKAGFLPKAWDASHTTTPAEVASFLRNYAEDHRLNLSIHDREMLRDAAEVVRPSE